MVPSTATGLTVSAGLQLTRNSLPRLLSVAKPPFEPELVPLLPASGGASCPWQPWGCYRWVDQLNGADLCTPHSQQRFWGSAPAAPAALVLLITVPISFNWSVSAVGLIVGRCGVFYLDDDAQWCPGVRTIPCRNTPLVEHTVGEEGPR